MKVYGYVRVCPLGAIPALSSETAHTPPDPRQFSSRRSMLPHNDLLSRKIPDNT